MSKEKKSTSSRTVVAAIDFGTTYSGYAYSFYLDWTNVHLSRWEGGTLVSYKAPTALLLNPDKSFNSFGYEAEKIYANIAEEDDEEGRSCKEYYFFHRFKMMLKTTLSKRVHRETKCNDENGRELEAMLVFTHSIRYLKDHLLKTMCKGFFEDSIKISDINFVLTVPAIWDDTAKMFMREAAIKAGIPENQLEIALEPEAASIYCHLMHLDDIRKDNTSGGPGHKYMVVDLGGAIFRRLSKADDKLLRSRPLAEYTDISPRRCGLKCFNHHLCSSFFINKEKKVCKLAGEVDLNKMIHSHGYLYYVSEDCKRSELGWEYRGSRDRTVSGIPCQRWDQQYPRTHSYQSLSGEQNFCRNPARAYARGPWCYTTAGNDAWDYCFIPKCVTPARECLETKRGEDYFGTINRTISGRQCMRWGDRPSGNQSYAILKKEGNYCRNPFSEKSTPWCYITKFQNDFEICDIPIC